MPPPSKPTSIKARALQWLAQREHSRTELRAKLLRAGRRGANGAAFDAPTGPSVEDVEALLDWLAEHGHLSEARFVESRVHARQRRFGTLRIRQELQQHGLQLDADAQRALTASEFERAQAVWARKFGGSSDDVAERARQMRFLAGRGFSPEVIRRVVRGGGADD